MAARLVEGASNAPTSVGRTDSSMNDNELRAVSMLIDALRAIICPHSGDSMFSLAFDSEWYDWFWLGDDGRLAWHGTEWRRYDGGDAE